MQPGVYQSLLHVVVVGKNLKDFANLLDIDVENEELRRMQGFHPGRRSR